MTLACGRQALFLFNDSAQSLHLSPFPDTVSSIVTTHQIDDLELVPTDLIYASKGHLARRRSHISREEIACMHFIRY